MCQSISNFIAASVDPSDPNPPPAALRAEKLRVDAFVIQHICYIVKLCSKTLDSFVQGTWQPLERLHLLGTINILYEFTLSPHGLGNLTTSDAKNTEIFFVWDSDVLVNFLEAVDGAMEASKVLKTVAIHNPEIASVASKAMINEKIVKVVSNCSSLVANPQLEGWFSIPVFVSYIRVLCAIPARTTAMYNYWREEMLKGRLTTIFLAVLKKLSSSPAEQWEDEVEDKVLFLLLGVAGNLVTFSCNVNSENRKYVDSPYDAKKTFKPFLEKEKVFKKE